MNSNKYDVFISYSNKDATWVTSVLRPRLESHSFSVFMDTDFTGGRLSIDQMVEGVEKSKRVIAVITMPFLQSGWTKLETTMAQTLDPSATQRKLVPVLLDDCELPLNLRVLHYRDLRANDEEQWDRLIQDLV